MLAKCISRIAIGLLVCSVTAAHAVMFTFSAPISKVYGPGTDAISNIVAVGMTCTGTVSYNLGGASADLDPSTNTGIYQFHGVDMQMSAKLGTNVFGSTDLSTCYITTMCQVGSPLSDGLTYEARGATLNGQPVPDATDSQYLDLALSTTNLSALISDAVPAQVPLLSAYPINGGSGFYQVVFYTYKNGSFDYGFSGTLTSLLPIPTLSAQAGSGQLTLSWPTNAAGFQLESTSNPGAPGSWIAVGGQPIIQDGVFQLVVLQDRTNRYFRLAQ